MACLNSVLRLFNNLFYLIVTLFLILHLAEANRELNEDNWREILEGEWMVKFHAPWCPACNALVPAWTQLSTRASKEAMSMKAAAVDITKSPGLSGRFVVTALPTIFHVKDGEFRQYKGPRDTDSMLSFVKEERWKQTEPIPGWKAPQSLQMTLVAEFFKLSQALRGVHNMLMETYGLPTWGSYLIFAVATIFIGALLGLILVCIIDLLYPPRRSEKVFIPSSEAEKLAGDDLHAKADDDQELINDDIVDDAERQLDSDAEKYSPPTSEDEKEKAEGGGDAEEDGEGENNDGKKNEVRKRRPRKAD